MDTDVVVVGLSIAGAATAYHLALLGHHVVLLERDDELTPSSSGGILHGVGTRELVHLGAQDIAGVFGAQPIRALCLSEDEGARVSSAMPAEGTSFGLRRSRLASWLHQRCEAHPLVEVRTGIEVLAVGISQSAVIVESDEGDLWARAIVGADGAHSKVRDELSLQPQRTSSPRVLLHTALRLPAGLPPDACLELVGGEGCLIRLVQTEKRTIDVAMWLPHAAITEVHSDPSGALFHRLEASPVASRRLEGARPVGSVQVSEHVFDGLPVITQRRALLVGEATLLHPTLTGLSLSAALIGARLAGEALSAALKADNLDADKLRGYQREFQRVTRDPARVSSAVDDAMSTASARRRLLRLLEAHPDTFSHLLQPFAGAQLSDVLGATDYWRLFNR